MTRARHALAWGLVALLAVQAAGCGAGAGVIPHAKRVTTISPWRYYDFWKALRVGKGILIGVGDGDPIAGQFRSAGGNSVLLRTNKGNRRIKIENITYIINVIDMNRGAEGALAGGLIGLGTGLSVAYMTGGGSPAPTPTPKAARATDDEWGSDDSSAGNSESSDSESNTNTTPEASSTESGESSTSDGQAATVGASSESSSGGGDPTATGSSTYEEGGSQQSSSSSSSSSSRSPSPSSGDNASESSRSNNESTVVVVGEGESSGGSSGSSSGGSRPSQTNPDQGSQSSTATRTFFYTVAFAAIGAAVGWAAGRRYKRATPRVDYVLFPKHKDDRGDLSPDQYLADKMVSASGERPVELLVPGSRFDTPRSAKRFDDLVDATVVRITPEIGATITASDARAYRLFPTVDDFMRAAIVQYGKTEEPSGTEARYFAIVTAKKSGTPTVSMQRLDPRDVITLCTQVNLIQAGILQ